MDADEINARLLYRDASMLVIDKPAGLPVHPGPGGGETLRDRLDHLRFGLPRRPEIVHRLDRDTSGCLVLGRHPKALRRLSELFRENRVEKLYWAVVEGGPAQDEGTIELPLAPLSPEITWRMRAAPDGLPSLTRFRVLRRLGDATLLALSPVTGRTHQLRVHCAAMGFPIRGDRIYGRSRRADAPALHLHARAITVPFSRNKAPVHVEAPLPPHMQAYATAL